METNAKTHFFTFTKEIVDYNVNVGLAWTRRSCAPESVWKFSRFREQIVRILRKNCKKSDVECHQDSKGPEMSLVTNYLRLA